MKKNFFKFLLLGALTFVVGASFVGCKDYDDDLERINERLETLEKLNNTLVKSVTYDPATGVLTVVPVSGTNSTFTIPGLNSLTLESSVSGDDVTIKLQGGSSTTFTLPAGGGSGFDPSKLTVAADGKVMYGDVATGAKVPVNSIVVNKNAAGTPIGYAILDQNGDELMVVNLGAEAVKGLGNLIFLGWIENVDEISKADVAASIDAATNDRAMSWAYIAKFQIEKNLANDTGTPADANAPASWSAQKDVATKQVLNTQTDSALLIQVFPTNQDISTLTFELRDSEGNKLPIKFDTPEPFDGLLTKAVSSSGLWVLPVAYTDGEPYPNAKAFTDKLPGGVVYSVVETSSGFFSNYTDNSILAGPQIAAPGAENGVNQLIPNGDEDAAVNTTTNGGVAVAGTQGEYVIQINTDYSVNFIDQTTANKTVVDYYFEAIDDFEAKGFDFSRDLKKGTFKVSADPDNFTPATMTVGVYKLNITGAIYYEEIKVTLVRSSVKYEVSIPSYEIIDVTPTADRGTLFTASPIKIDLAPMFTQFGEEFTLRWQSASYGAQAITIESWTYLDGTEQAVDGVLSGGTLGLYAANGTTDVSGTPYATRNITIPVVWGKTGPTATLNVGKLNTITLLVMDKDYEINTIVVKFTPTLPDPNDLIVKNTDLFWKENVLQAYYKRPKFVADDSIAFATGATTGLKDSVPDYDFSVAHADVGYGGFITLGGDKTKDAKWADMAFGFPDGANEQKIGGKGVRNTPLAGYSGGNDSMAVLLYGQNTATYALNTALPGASLVGKPEDPYGVPLKIVPNAAKYLGLYDFSAAQVANAGFEIKLMSALYEGSITVGEALKATAGGGVGYVAVLNNKNIKAKTYSGEEYELFPTIPTTPVGATKGYYKYTYIKSVEFSRPAEAVGVYKFVDADGNDLPDQSKAVATASGTPKEFGLRILVFGQISAGKTIPVNVTVTDRFGKVKKESVELNITLATDGE